MKTHESKEKRAVLVIGVGNEYRSDDGVGLMVARRLTEMGIEGVCAIHISSEGMSLLEAWQDSEMVVLVDAISSGGEPGTVYRIDASNLDAGDVLAGVSTHGFGIGEAIGLGRAIGQLPHRLIIYGIEGKRFDPGLGLSPEVEESVSELLKEILEELRCMNTQ
jgi:hydrogenase maturation protease